MVGVRIPVPQHVSVLYHESTQLNNIAQPNQMVRVDMGYGARRYVCDHGDSPTMKLTSQQEEKVKAFLYQLGPICPMCGGKGENWSLIEDLLEAPIWEGGTAKTLGSVTYPLVGIGCIKCHYMLFFNAIDLGLIRQR